MSNCWFPLFGLILAIWPAWLYISFGIVYYYYYYYYYYYCYSYVHCLRFKRQDR
jgi:hypothetical protein